MMTLQFLWTLAEFRVSLFRIFLGLQMTWESHVVKALPARSPSNFWGKSVSFRSWTNNSGFSGMWKVRQELCLYSSLLDRVHGTKFPKISREMGDCWKTCLKRWKKWLWLILLKKWRSLETAPWPRQRCPAEPTFRCPAPIGAGSSAKAYLANSWIDFNMIQHKVVRRKSGKIKQVTKRRW